MYIYVDYTGEEYTVYFLSDGVYENGDFVAADTSSIPSDTISLTVDITMDGSNNVEIAMVADAATGTDNAVTYTLQNQIYYPITYIAFLSFTDIYDGWLDSEVSAFSASFDVSECGDSTPEGIEECDDGDLDVSGDGCYYCGVE